MAGGKRAGADCVPSEPGKTDTGRGDYMKQNYAEYHFSKTEILKYLIQSILLCGAMDYLFYQNWWLML